MLMRSQSASVRGFSSSGSGPFWRVKNWVRNSFGGNGRQQQHHSQQRRQQPYQQPQFQRQQLVKLEQSETSAHCSVCNICGHTAESCYRAQRRCLINGAYDHRARACPRSRQQAPPAPPQGQGQRGRGRRRGQPHQQQIQRVEGQVFALNRQQAEESTGDLVEGILPLFGYSA